MTSDHSPESAALVTKVVAAFESMPLPPAPPRQETKEILREGEREGADVERRRPAARWSLRRRLAVGGIGLSTVAALVLLAVALQGNRPLAAMDRLARQLRAVASYQYEVHSETTTTEKNPPRQTTWRETGTMFWQAPDSFRNQTKIVKIETDGTQEKEPELLVDFVEIFPPGALGIFINNKQQTYFRCQFEPTGSRAYPLEPLKQIREDSPPPIRELGTRQIGGQQARGYRVKLKTGFPPREHDWEVWVDPDTDLPLEIGYQVDDQQEPRTTTTLRIGNFRWNEPLDARLFTVQVPEGYREVPAPQPQNQR